MTFARIRELATLGLEAREDGDQDSVARAFQEILALADEAGKHRVWSAVPVAGAP